MGVVVVVGTNFSRIAVDIGSMVHTDSEMHTTTDTGLAGKVHDGSAIALVHPESIHCSSSSMCLPSFPLRAGMLCNISLHVLLTYKIYKRGFSRYLLPFANINTHRRDVL